MKLVSVHQPSEPLSAQRSPPPLPPPLSAPVPQCTSKALLLRAQLLTAPLHVALQVVLVLLDRREVDRVGDQVLEVHPSSERAAYPGILGQTYVRHILSHIPSKYD